ncbi:MAG: hypothetical protein KDI03_12480 [Anaerolineae bacterium]|nr:hypothetical protein [Anaerolineae bacterium]MCB0205050.1 hypothetical protein [Anaerolineae bacterium]
MNNDLVLAFNSQGQLLKFKPMAAAMYRAMAQRLIDEADGAVVAPNVQTEKPPEKETDEQDTA